MDTVEGSKCGKLITTSLYTPFIIVFYFFGLIIISFIDFDKQNLQCDSIPLVYEKVMFKRPTLDIK